MNLSFIGAGNIAFHLAQSLDELGFSVLSVISKSGHSAEILAKKVGARSSKEIRDIDPQTDVIFICIPDDEIAEVSNRINQSGRVVIHTSGSVGMNSLSQHVNSGVLYPLQSFSTHTDVNFWNIPVLLESSNTTVERCLEQISEKLSSNVRYVNSKQRKAIHVAAVFANNFTNHLLTMAKDICERHEVDFELLHPLISNTIDKALNISPEDSQTGPAVRNDLATIEKHRVLLNSDPKTLEIYNLITSSIMMKYNSSNDEK